MPAGVSWSQYLSFCAAAAISMVAGAQIVHQYYKPLRDMDKYIRRELETLPDNVKAKIIKELEDENLLKPSAV